jgi:hypothetical protein
MIELARRRRGAAPPAPAPAPAADTERARCLGVFVDFEGSFEMFQ